MSSSSFHEALPEAYFSKWTSYTRLPEESDDLIVEWLGGGNRKPLVQLNVLQKQKEADLYRLLCFANGIPVGLRRRLGMDVLLRWLRRMILVVRESRVYGRIVLVVRAAPLHLSSQFARAAHNKI